VLHEAKRSTIWSQPLRGKMPIIHWVKSKFVFW